MIAMAFKILPALILIFPDRIHRTKLHLPVQIQLGKDQCLQLVFYLQNN